MSKIHKNIISLIGSTPLVDLSNYSRSEGCVGRLIAKIEYFNPGGSVKDRIALAMVDSAVASGALKAGGTIIEPTSGNTGIGLAMVSAARGYRLILTMPESMSIERRRILTALGAELHLTPAAEGMGGAIRRADELSGEIAGSVVMRQFENAANPKAHEATTGEEIWRDCDGAVDVFVAGVGTGGTVSGVGRALKGHNPKVEIVGVEPEASPVLSGGKAGPHKIQGIGAGFVPKNYDASVVDRVVAVGNEQAYQTVRRVATSEGIMVGVSSGAALYVATQIAKQEEYRGKNIVVLLPDTGERYLSIEGLWDAQ